MNSVILRALSATMIVFGVSGTAAHGATAGAPEASYIAVGGPTSVPYGWVDFCGREPQECDQPVMPARDLNLTPETWQILNRVNRAVNAAIVPVSNYDHWGTLLDHWDYPLDGKGDCKVYALEKRRELIEKGFPRQALLMTVVKDLSDEGHAILTVKTNRGEFILDNLTDTIRPWDATGYQFLKRQSQEDPNVWLAIGGPSPVHVSSR
jgi:predicted transglutaminase-like cysteine proteinase